MLVILREAVENLGQIGDVVRVKDGYARNFLLPRKLVSIADEGNVAQIEHTKKTLEKRRQAQRADSEAVAQKLAAHTITLKRKVGEQDKLFGSVSSHDVAEALAGAGFKVEKRMIQLEHAIKSLGVYSVIVKLDTDVSTNVKLWVVKEEA